MYQQQQKTPFCALTMYLRSTGKKSPKFEYKADAKSLFTCSLTHISYHKLTSGIIQMESKTL